MPVNQNTVYSNQPSAYPLLAGFPQTEVTSEGFIFFTNTHFFEDPTSDVQIFLSGRWAVVAQQASKLEREQDFLCAPCE